MDNRKGSYPFGINKAYIYIYILLNTVDSYLIKILVLTQVAESLVRHTDGEID